MQRWIDNTEGSEQDRAISIMNKVEMGKKFVDCDSFDYSDDTVHETCCGKIRESRKTGLTMNQLRRLVRESSDGAYTAHVYDDNGNPVEYSELNCAVFVSLEEAKREARKYLAKNGGIVDISFDSEENEDPEFVWSSEDDD